jgi:hypothetical protein
LRAGVDGVGVVLLPAAWVSAGIADGKLVQLLSDWSARWADFVLYYSSRRHVPIKLRAFADFLKRESKQAGRSEPEFDRDLPIRGRAPAQDLRTKICADPCSAVGAI